MHQKRSCKKTPVKKNKTRREEESCFFMQEKWRRGKKRVQGKKLWSKSRKTAVEKWIKSGKREKTQAARSVVALLK